MAYISEKCEHRGAVDVERHPAGLRVFTHFFEEQTLPEELYRILWQRLDLKTPSWAGPSCSMGTFGPGCWSKSPTSPRESWTSER